MREAHVSTGGRYGAPLPCEDKTHVLLAANKGHCGISQELVHDTF